MTLLYAVNNTQKLKLKSYRWQMKYLEGIEIHFLKLRMNFKTKMYFDELIKCVEFLLNE